MSKKKAQRKPYIIISFCWLLEDQLGSDSVKGTGLLRVTSKCVRPEQTARFVSFCKQVKKQKQYTLHWLWSVLPCQEYSVK